jgi:hypothetical protein
MRSRTGVSNGPEILILQRRDMRTFCAKLTVIGQATTNVSNSKQLYFFPESERTGPPVGGRPHSTVQRARARRQVTV